MAKPKRYLRFFSNTEGIVYKDKTMRLSFRFIFSGVIISVVAWLAAYFLSFEMQLLMLAVYLFGIFGSYYRAKRIETYIDKMIKKDVIDVPLGWDGTKRFFEFEGLDTALGTIIGLAALFLWGYSGPEMVVQGGLVFAGGFFLGLGSFYLRQEVKHGVKLCCYKYDKV